MTNWKAALVVAIGIGVGLGIVAVAVIAYMTPNTGWNSKAIRATFVSAEYSATPSPAAYFTYTLENTSKRDYSVKLASEKDLPTNLRAAALRGPISFSSTGNTKGASLVFGAINFYLPESGQGMGIEQLVNGEPLFLPAKQKINIRLRWEFTPDELNKTSSANIVNSSLFGFILYDDATHYEIDFPKPSPVAGKYTEADVKVPSSEATTVDPDKLQPWEEYAACDETAKLVQACKVAKLYTPANVPQGYRLDSLPPLPSPPPGYTMEATESRCHDVAQWEPYCAAHPIGQ